jgi:hypothetical protein
VTDEPRTRRISGERTLAQASQVPLGLKFRSCTTRS